MADDNRIRLTLKNVADFPHPVEGKAFLWDTAAPTLAVLASPKRKNYIFESRLNGKTLRVTIGDVKTFTLEAARVEANRLKALVNQGIDPRELKRQKEAEKQILFHLYKNMLINAVRQAPARNPASAGRS